MVFDVYRNVVCCLAIFLVASGCTSDEATPTDDNAANTNNQTVANAAVNATANNGMDCNGCGYNVCNEPCEEGCCCACVEGDERARNGGLERCTGGCYERVGVNPNVDTRDMGVPDATDMGVDMLDTSPDAQADAAPPLCAKSPNGDSPPTDTCMHGAADWLAWEWIPDEDMTITELRLHTDEGFGALLADDGTGRPGAVIVEGALSDANADGWRTLPFPTPASVTSGTRYWIGEDVLTCSTAEDGVEFTYYSADSTAGPWNGPFMAHPFTAQIAGTCP